MSKKNGEPPTSQEKLNVLAEHTLLNDERIEKLWDLMIEIRIGVADEGGIKLKNDKEWRYAFQRRAETAALRNNQRERLRKWFGLT